MIIKILFLLHYRSSISNFTMHSNKVRHNVTIFDNCFSENYKILMTLFLLEYSSRYKLSNFLKGLEKYQSA